MITGGCHCGRVRFALPALPAEVTRCNCSICAKLGALWAYYPPDALEITRAMLDEPRFPLFSTMC